MGLLGFEYKNKIENDQKNYYNPQWYYQETISNQTTLPHELTLMNILSDEQNQIFDYGKCLFHDEQKEFKKMINEKYGPKFQEIYDLLENNGFKYKEWFDEGSWSVDAANSICDWIFTRIYFFKDFKIDKLI